MQPGQGSQTNNPHLWAMGFVGLLVFGALGIGVLNHLTNR